MELEITQLAKTDAFPFSASAAEMGDNAGQLTWQNNIREAPDLLDNEEKREAFRDFMKSSGGWTREEIDAWGHKELNALCHQWIMGDIRECPATLEGITFRQEPDGWYHENESTPGHETGPFDSRHEAYADAAPTPPERADSLEEIDWLEYQVQAEHGNISGRLYCTGEGEERRYSFSISN